MNLKWVAGRDYFAKRDLHRMTPHRLERSERAATVNVPASAPTRFPSHGDRPAGAKAPLLSSCRVDGCSPNQSEGAMRSIADVYPARTGEPTVFLRTPSLSFPVVVPFSHLLKYFFASHFLALSVRVGIFILPILIVRVSIGNTKGARTDLRAATARRGSRMVSKDIIPP